MTNITIHTQITPNPNAWKFLVSQDVIAAGKASFDSAADAEEVPLAAALFTIPNVSQILFFENVITVTQDGDGSWRELEDNVRACIMDHIADHDTNITTADEAAKPDRSELSADLQKIEEILDRTIRPALQGDGGDLDIVRYEDDKKLLLVQYQGACGSCPSATMGTLMAIKGILEDEFDPDIEVIPV